MTAALVRNEVCALLCARPKIEPYLKYICGLIHRILTWATQNLLLVQMWLTGHQLISLAVDIYLIMPVLIHFSLLCNVLTEHQKSVFVEKFQ